MTVRLCQVGAARAGVDLDAMLASGELSNDQRAWYGDYHGKTWPGGRNTWTTDADGRFEVRGGVGRDRIAWLSIEGPMLAEGTLFAMARSAKTAAEAPPAADTPESGHDVLRASARASALRRDVRAHRRPDQADHRRRPLEGDGQTLARGHGPRHGGGDLDVGRGQDRRARAASGWSACPRARSIRSPPTRDRGIDPFLGARINVTDTEGLKPIETTLELPRGVIITGRLIDPATGRPVRAGQISYVKLPTNPHPGDNNQARTSPIDPTFRLTVPPGEGMLYAQARGKDLPYLTARLRKADKGKGIGGMGDGETYRSC